MSILSALKQNSSSIDDLAKLPQAMIMQMAQKKSISADMVAPILARKAEMMDAVARTKSMQQPEQAPPSVLEQLMAKNIGIENPMQAPMPQSPADIGVGQLPVPERQYAGGGIVAFNKGDLVDLEDDMDDEDLIAEYAAAMQAGEMAMMQQQGLPQGNAGVGIRYQDPLPRGGVAGLKDNASIRDRLHDIVIAKESGGRRYAKDGSLLTSSKGALGERQVMPYTAKDPGFGIKAARDNSPDELARVGKEYLDVMLDRYNDPKLAMIAYNMGPGATDKWLKAGANIKDLPKETRGYISNVNLAEGGTVQHYDGTGPSLVEAKKQREDALKALELALPDMPSDFTGSLSDYLSNPERASNYKQAAKDREIARKAIMYNNPLPTLNRDILNPSASMKSSVMSKAGKAQLQDIDEASRLAVPPVAVKGSGNYIPNDNLDMDNRDVGMQRGVPTINASAQAKTPEENYYDKFIKQMGQERADLAKQKTEDRNMALLAAGLGMMGGASSNAFTNIGQGALSGVQYLSEANKQRAAQQAALTKNELVAQRYKELGETAKGNQAGLMALRAGQLAVDQGTLENNQKKVLEGSLDRMDKAAAASAQAWIKANPMAGFSLENAGDVEQIKQQMLAKNQRYQTVYRQLEGTDFVVPNLGTTTGGGTLAEQAAAIKAKRDAEKNKEKK